MKEFIESEFRNISCNFIHLQALAPQIEQAATMCIEALRRGNKIMFCGNGGSAADSQHLAAELVGRYKMNRPAMNAVALTVDTSILTAVGNDYGYDTIFERQVEGIGKEGDVLVGLSTSGNSKNVLLAFAKAKKQGIKTLALTGNAGGKMQNVNLPPEGACEGAYYDPLQYQLSVTKLFDYIRNRFGFGINKIARILHAHVFYRKKRRNVGVVAYSAATYYSHGNLSH